MITAIQNASDAFDAAPLNMDFFLVGIRYHNASEYADFTLDELNELLVSYNLYTPNSTTEYAINLYFVPNADANGYGTLPPSRGNLVNEVYLRSGIVIKNSRALTSTVPHEFGHFFGLFHTNGTGILPQEEPDGSNCAVAGDLICDTAPEPKSDNNWAMGCVTNVPPASPYYPGILANKNNYMIVTPDESCRDRFTQGQRSHMRDQFDSGGTYSDRSDLKDRVWIQVRNEIAETDAGGTYKVSSQTYNSGDYFLYSSQVDIITGQERLQTDYKHHDWNAVNQEFKLTLENFVGTPASETQRARFVELETAIIKNNLISANGADNGKITFHDPWFLESNGSQPDGFIEFVSPYQPTGSRNESSGGVFLNQNPDPGDPTVPHYSVRAEEQVINGTTYFLENWSGSNVSFEDQRVRKPLWCSLPRMPRLLPI